MAILLHELGHGLAARLMGATGISITLWALGGLCSSRRDIVHAGREIFILACGPLVSLGLWIGSWAALHWAPREFLELPFVLHFLVVTMFVNELLFFFNILPIFPLDGGQIVFHTLRSLIDVRIAAKICLVVAILGSIAYYAYRCYNPETGAVNHDTFLAVMLGFLCYQSFNYLH